MIPTPKFFPKQYTQPKRGQNRKEMQKEVKRTNQISIKFNTTQIERSTL